MDHLLTLQGKDHLVAVVPLLAETASSSTARRAKNVDYDSLDIDALNRIGTAARIIQLTRVAQVRRKLQMHQRLDFTANACIHALLSQHQVCGPVADRGLGTDTGRLASPQSWKGEHQLSTGVLGDRSSGH